MFASDLAEVTVDDGKVSWTISVPLRWHWLDAEDGLAQMFEIIEHELTGWLADPPDELGEQDPDRLASWRLGTQADIISCVRSLIDENPDVSLAVGVDLVGVEGSTIVTVLGVRLETAGPSPDGSTPEDQSELDPIFQFDRYVANGNDIERMWGPRSTGDGVAAASWLVSAAGGTVALRVDQRSIGAGSIDLLGVGNHVVETANYTSREGAIG